MKEYQTEKSSNHKKENMNKSSKHPLIYFLLTAIYQIILLALLHLSFLFLFTDFNSTLFVTKCTVQYEQKPFKIYTLHAPLYFSIGIISTLQQKMQKPVQDK